MKCPYSNKGICELGIANKCEYNISFSFELNCEIPNDLGMLLEAIKSLKRD